ncbi:MAG: nucleotidyltransferase domain-containing protein [Armatimonadetes bacterium]|nr:nucleotidyltransferase domain-containing protein [Armatimonadota bacterium]
MGIEAPQHIRLADALFTNVQQKVLGILFGRPDRSFLSKEVIALADSGTGAVHRELKRLAASGLVTVRSAGWEKHYQANQQSPVFEELRALVVKTVGLIEPIREALASLADRIRVAFVYGSQAKGTDNVSSDVDVLIVSEDLTHAEAYAALAKAERVLARAINPTIVSYAEWQERQHERDHFLENVSAGPKLFVLGSQDDLV